MSAPTKKEVIEELKSYGMDTNHYTYRELLNKLQVVRAEQMNIECDENKYF